MKGITNKLLELHSCIVKIFGGDVLKVNVVSCRKVSISMSLITDQNVSSPSTLTAVKVENFLFTKPSQNNIY